MNNHNSAPADRGKIKLRTGHRAVLFALMALVWLSGTAWVYVQYFVEHPSDSAAFRSPLQITSMQMHGGLCLLFLVCLGTLSAHVQRAWGLKVNRTSGSLVIFSCLLLTVSGWMLYYVSADHLREYASLLHILIGIPFPVLLYAHIKLGRAWLSGPLSKLF